MLVTGSLNQGGAEYQIISLAKLLISKGYNIELFALTDYSYYLPYVKLNNIKYSCINKNYNDIQRFYTALKKIISSRPDLVISYIKKVSQIAILARLLSGFKFKLMISERTSAIRYWHDIYYFNLALLADKILVNSISKYMYITTRFPLTRKRAVFTPNLIDIKRFSTIQYIRPIHGIAKLAFVGRISPEKNLLNLVRAIEIVNRSYPKVVLYIIGEANNRKYLEELTLLINELSISDNVIIKDPVKEITDIYKNTDLLCLVSFFEGFSNVLSEAMACGIPIIASDIPENRYLIEDGENGFLVEPSNPSKIAESIIRFVQMNQNDIQSISDKNRAKANALFQEEATYQIYKSLFESVFPY